ncbi:MAG: C1 family peptidase [Eggerthellaceae bacterium]|nr:C1 family peptidase [Eggerthellaceae bacterium]
MAKKSAAQGVMRSAVQTAARDALSLALAASLAVCLTPASALADGGAVVDAWLSAAAEQLGAQDTAYSTANAGVEDAFADTPSFDLRDEGVVSPVKNQGVWGTCWGFSAIAAAEASILSELKQKYPDTYTEETARELDLSERHLAYFTYSSAPAAAGAQEGEGYRSGSDDPNAAFNLGGYMVYATTLFSAGVGPVPETLAPYKNDEGIIVCTVTSAEEGSSDSEVAYVAVYEDQLESKQEEYARSGQDLSPYYYAASVAGEDGSSIEHTTWSLPDEAWNLSTFELEGSNILPEMCVFDADGTYAGYSQEAMNAVKSELRDHGRAVSMSYYSGDPMPGQEGTDEFISENWAHYTYAPIEADHAVTIVGWDDNYPAGNFNQGTADDGTSRTPPGNGAWLVKNSWGSETEEFPNAGSWGVEDENGNHTGYFWLSYYDQSITALETFDFDVDSYGYHADDAYSEEKDANMFWIDQYNLMPATNVLALRTAEESAAANVFTAEYDCTVRTLTCETTQPNTAVSYDLYLLDAADAAPTDGTLAAHAEAVYEYGGYHRLTLDRDAWVPVGAGQTYAVVVTQQCVDEDGSATYLQSVAMNDSSRDDDAPAREAGFECVAVVNEGESYTCVGGEWVDWAQVAGALKAANESVVFDNFPIKAFVEITDAAAVQAAAEADAGASGTDGMLTDAGEGEGMPVAVVVGVAAVALLAAAGGVAYAVARRRRGK